MSRRMRIGALITLSAILASLVPVVAGAAPVALMQLHDNSSRLVAARMSQSPDGSRSIGYYIDVARGPYAIVEMGSPYGPYTQRCSVLDGFERYPDTLEGRPVVVDRSVCLPDDTWTYARVVPGQDRIDYSYHGPAVCVRYYWDAETYELVSYAESPCSVDVELRAVAPCSTSAGPVRFGPTPTEFGYMLGSEAQTIAAADLCGYFRDDTGLDFLNTDLGGSSSSSDAVLINTLSRLAVIGRPLP